MKIKKNNLLLFFIVVTMAAMAQKPVFHSLNSNATLIQYHKNKAKQNNHIQLNNRTQSTSTVALSLPFYDEFSYTGPFPDTARWQNSQSVFVNHSKAIAPPTLGVATFDGLNKFGYPYNSAITSVGGQPTIGQPSDTLTSVSIRLDSVSGQSLSPVDSVYLSFYYQGMGYWDKPDPGDYLYLDLYSQYDNSWSQVWGHDGYHYDPDSSWHLAMIPIIDTAYFHKDFKFRFRNLSGSCGDIDHWHLDAVYLNKGRKSKDTMFNAATSAFDDVSFVYDLQSPLKNYSQMPYKQYSGSNDMKKGISTFLRNNYSTLVSVTTNYAFNNRAGSVLYSNSPGSNNIPNYYNAGYYNDTIVRPSLNNFVYPLSPTYSSFTFKFFISSIDTLHNNDTITFNQTFNNYYAYDDGSAETGAGIDLGPGGPGNYKTAARFTLNVADTLHAMDIFFDPLINVDLIKNAPFNILVWADNNGVPGNIIYTDSLRYVYFPADSLINGLIKRENNFLRYQFRDSVPLAAGTTFYIGINQIYNEPEITIGFDRNTDFHKNMFYNSNGTNWYVYPGDLDADYRGSLMIRPVFGTYQQTVSIDKYKSTSASINIYPNPATDEVYIQSENTISKIVVTDLLGNVVLQQVANSVQKINTLSLQSGVYLIKAFTDKGFADTQKLIIAK
jgi:hypothetical protein